jgi:ferritin-like metal-binding protein YciE
MKINSVEDLFVNGLKYVYDAEKQLTQAIPELAQAACAPQLREAFDQHLQETKEHVGRCEEIFKRLRVQPQAEPNVVVEQMRAEARQMIERIDQSEIRDAALIVACNQVEHYEISAYGSLRTFAQLLGYQDIVNILQKTLDEEKRADAKLTQVADMQVNIRALHKSEAAHAMAATA